MMTTGRRPMLSAGTIFAVVALAVVGLATSSVRAAALAQTANAVQIQSFAFAPNPLEVPVGTSVSWTNNDQAPHTATARDGSFDTGEIAPGETKSATLNTAGTFEYFCAVHPRMVATVVVRGAAAAPSTMPATGLRDAPAEALAVLGLLALLAGLSVSLWLRRRTIA